MFAVLANIFNFGVVELFLQKVEFLHEIFFFFFPSLSSWSQDRCSTVV